MRQVLDGITVVEVSDGVAGSYCGKLFADLGAQVWKVEPPAGDGLRPEALATALPAGSAHGGAFLHLNTNKRSLVVDDATAPDHLARLLATATLLIDATAGGQLAEWLNLEQLRAAHPSLSVVRISGFGATGPYAGRQWSDLVVEAMAGVLLRQGVEGQRPVRLPGELGSCFVGSVAALGALAAVLGSEGGATGCTVDCSAVEALASIPAKAATLLAYQYRDGESTTLRASGSGATLIPTGVFPCGDGYMAMMSTPQQLGEMLEVLGDDHLKEVFARPDAFERGETKEELDAVLYPWLLSRTRAEATAEAQRVGWPLAGVNTPEEVLEADHLHQRGFWVHADDPDAGSIDLPGAPVRFAEGGWALRRLAPALGPSGTASDAADAADAGGAGDAPRAAAASGRRSPPRPPLEGVRIVDMTTVWSGPYATMLLADLGAEVIRVENPWVLPPTTKGYTARPNLSDPGFLGSLYGRAADGRPDRPWNRHAMNNSLARNKLSCTIDTRRPEGHDLLMQLIDRSDVFIENFKASGLARIGVSVSEMQVRNPRLIVVRMPPTGLTGDWSGYTGFGAQFDGLTGLLWLCGEPDEDLTMNPATTYMDAASGPATAFATVAALRYRESTGRGQVVEFAQAENILNHLGDVFVDAQLGATPGKQGNRHSRYAPQGLYRCAGEDLWLALSVADDAGWRSMCAVIGRDELAGDARFATAAARHANHDELDAVIAAWAAGQDPTVASAALQDAGVAAGPVLDDAAFTNDPHVRARGWLRPLESSDLGTHLHQGTAFSGVPMAWRRGSPVLGEDNEYVYRTILGVSEQDYQRYRDEQILADDYLDPTGRPY